ncbi:MAG: hypothetical protein ACRDOF_08040 [Gaiellaceae bacterium]
MNVRAVGEESHLEEMRSAIRGDFERLAERRGDQKLMVVAEERAESGQEPEAAAEVPQEAPRRPRSWLARLLRP